MGSEGAADGVSIWNGMETVHSKNAEGDLGKDTPIPQIIETNPGHKHVKYIPGKPGQLAAQITHMEALEALAKCPNIPGKVSQHTCENRQLGTLMQMSVMVQ